jgi:hypothetical protein
MTQKRRATSLKELGAIMAPMFDADKMAKSLQVTLRPNDVVITPFAKCGTTWTQQIVHCLRTRGDMNFDDISRVVPWIERSENLGINLDAEQVAPPRAFKSHLGWDDMPWGQESGARYIVPIRDPKDALYSAYKFMEGWFVEPGTIPLDDFARVNFIGSGNYYKHLLSWWPRRNDDDVLMLVFENMKQDLPGTIRQIATFIEIDLDDELLAITEEHASLAFMQRHKDKFDDLLMRELSERVAHIPPGSDSAKVRSGQVGEHAQHLSNAVQAKLDTAWQQTVGEALGFPDYSSLRAALG